MDKEITPADSTPNMTAAISPQYSDYYKCIVLKLSSCVIDAYVHDVICFSAFPLSIITALKSQYELY